MEGLVDLAFDGLAILDDDRHYRYVNAAGCGLLGRQAGDLVGRPANEFPPYRSALRSGDRQAATSAIPGGAGILRLQYLERMIDGVVLVAFRDVTDRLRGDRQLAAFAQTTSSIANLESLDDVLDTVARQVLEATRVPSCTLVLFSRSDGAIERIGTAGGYPSDYPARLEACRQLGAPLVSLEAHQAGAPVVVPDWCQMVLADSRWAPVHEVLRGKDWGTLAAIPLSSRSDSIGALTAFYPRGRHPDPVDISFLVSIAELATVAVQNHRMRADIERRTVSSERQRIARDLHDALTQSLFSLVLQAETLQLVSQREGSGDRDRRIRTGLADLRALAEDVHAEMRVLIHHLRPTELGSGGLVEAVRRYADGLAGQHGVQIDVTASLPAGTLDLATEEGVYRVVQEALNNAARHSGARRVSALLVEGEGEPHGLSVTVTDDGHGFDPSNSFPGHWGLLSMRERAAELGGTVHIASSRAGTRLSLAVPTSRGARP
jgi:signal transduction histidine kinase